MCRTAPCGHNRRNIFKFGLESAEILRGGHPTAEFRLRGVHTARPDGIELFLQTGAGNFRDTGPLQTQIIHQSI